MFDRLSKDASGHHSRGSRTRPKAGDWLRVEPLEARALLASLAPITSVSVEGSSSSSTGSSSSGAGYQVPLNGAVSGNTDPETYTVTTDNTTSGVTASIATGEFWTIGVSHASSGTNDPAFSGTMTFQLFQDLTPTAVSKIESLITGTVPYGDLTTQAQSVIYPNGQGTTGVDYYTAAGDTIHRITDNLGSVSNPDVVPGSYIVQGGSLNGDGTGQVFETPYANETSSQLVFNGSGQLALANSGGTDTNDSQFFITTGALRELDGGYTIFGQLVAGANILADLTQVATQASTSGTVASTPIDAVKIISSSLSTTSPNGVVHINATAATANTLTNVTVHATDTTNNTQTSQTFPVITIPSATGSEPTTNAPVLSPVTTPIDTAENTAATFQLTATNPNNGTLTYVVDGGLSAGTTTTGPTFDATVSDGTATVTATGLVTVTPTAGYSGPINLVVGVSDGTNRAGSPGATTPTSDPANFSLQYVTVEVGSFSAAPTLTPVTTPINASVSQTVQFPLSATNPSGGTLSYIVEGSLDSTTNTFSAPTNATASVSPTGVVTVVPNAGYTGEIDLVVGVRDQTDRSGTGNLNSPSNYNTEDIVIKVASQASTGAVRFIQDSSTAATGNLIVTPLPQTTKNASNTIDVTQNAAGDAEVIVNGTVDTNQPALNDVESIIVYGSKAKDRITVDPTVTVPVSLSGGTGGKDVLTAGGGPTFEQGWQSTSTVEKQGEGTNYLFGKAGSVTFVEGSGTNSATFAGTPGKLQGHSRIRHLPAIPSGTFYTFKDGKLVKTSNPFTTPVKTTTTTTTTAPSTTASTSSTKDKKK